MHKITKLKSTDNPMAPTATTHDQYRATLSESKFGESSEPLSPNVDYWVAGYLKESPAIGKCLVMDRKFRNGLQIDGCFTTSPIISITDDQFTTLNSIYRIEKFEIPS